MVSVPEDVDEELGPLDEAALEEMRTVFERQEPLATEIGFPSLIDPQELRVSLDGGIGDATEARLDVRWFRSGYYNIHHTDPTGQDFRWDYHPKDGMPDRHFHPPPDPDATDPVRSCITVEQPVLVARIVHKLWRRAFDTGNLAHLNTANNPP
jgi:hypothetical protein